MLCIVCLKIMLHNDKLWVESLNSETVLKGLVVIPGSEKATCVLNGNENKALFYVDPQFPELSYRSACHLESVSRLCTDSTCQ